MNILSSIEIIINVFLGIKLFTTDEGKKQHYFHLYCFIYSSNHLMSIYSIQTFCCILIKCIHIVTKLMDYRLLVKNEYTNGIFQYVEHCYKYRIMDNSDLN